MVYQDLEDSILDWRSTSSTGYKSFSLRVGVKVYREFRMEVLNSLNDWGFP